MQKFIRVLYAAALIGLAVWLWWVLFPSPERIIRSQLKKLADTVSFEAKEGTISKGYKAQRLTDFFPLEVEINIDVPGYPAQSVTGRDELMRGLLGAQNQLSGLKVVFPDISVTLAPDKQSATVNLTVDVKIGGMNEPIIQELNVTFRKFEKRWLITRIDTVKTLSQQPVRLRLPLISS